MSVASNLDTLAREIALFFLFSLLDQRVALSAAHKAIAQVKALSSENEPASRAAVARILKSGFDSHRRLLPRNQSVELSDSALSLPQGTDMPTWTKFHSTASDDEITAVVLTQILGYKEEEVAEGFDVSVGTMKYRISKGIRHLGAAVPKSGSAS